MWLANLVFVAVSAFFISACQSASVAETALNPRTQRLGNTVRYYQTSWEHLLSGVDLEPVENSAAGATALDLDADTNVAIVVHGRESSVRSDFASALKYSLAAADKVNLVIILLDWSFMSISPYQQLVALVPFIAEDLKDFMALLDDANLNRERLHLIGFDLGAHIVGIASRTSATSARKITALSPAGERWDASSQRLRGTDADYVEVIHTDAVGNRANGLTEAIGNPALDIFANGGTRQPGCTNSDNACHHRRAYQLFAATVDTGGHLIAMRCDTMAQVNNNRCVGTPAVFVGTSELVKLQAGEHEWTVVMESPNNCKDFGTTHVQTIVDLLRFSLDRIHGVVSDMLSNVL